VGVPGFLGTWHVLLDCMQQCLHRIFLDCLELFCQALSTIRTCDDGVNAAAWTWSATRDEVLHCLLAQMTDLQQTSLA